MTRQNSRKRPKFGLGRAIMVGMTLATLNACNTLHKIPGIGGAGNTSDGPPPLPDVYTIKGTTIGNFDLIQVRVADSSVTVKVNRPSSPEAGEHICDRFEVYTTTAGTGGGAIRFGYLNLTVGGVSVPVAPKGTQYEITSMRVSGGSHELY